MRSRMTSQSRRSLGFTLVELLIVMGIMVILAAVTLPSLKSLLSGQKVSEATRIVSTYAENCKARAVTTGRPVSLILERASYSADGGLGSTNMCLRLSMGDVFPAYQGDYASASGWLSDPDGDGVLDALDIPIAEAATLAEVTGFVEAQDLIEIGVSRQRYLIREAPTTSTVTDPVSGTSIPVVRVKFMLELPRDEGGLPTARGANNALSQQRFPFRIYRKPSKSMAGSVRLPRGTCVDLHMSGLGPAGRQFSSDMISLSSDTYPPDVSTGNWDYGPIYIIFGPTGQAETWYRQQRFSDGSTTFARGRPGGLIHLLIGRTEQVASPRFDSVAAMSAAEGSLSNIMDAENSWVTINPYTGGITSSSMPAPSAASMSSIDARVIEARTLATNALSEPTL